VTTYNFSTASSINPLATPIEFLAASDVLNFDNPGILPTNLDLQIGLVSGELCLKLNFFDGLTTHYVNIHFTDNPALLPQTDITTANLTFASGGVLVVGDNAVGSAELNPANGFAIHGTNFADSLASGDSADSISAGGGDDDIILSGLTGPSSDTVDGGLGFDGLNFADNFFLLAVQPQGFVELSVNLNKGVAHWQWPGAPAATIAISNVEGIQGTSGNDLIVGDSGHNVLDGHGSHSLGGGTVVGDTLTGGAAADQFVFDPSRQQDSFNTITDMSQGDEIHINNAGAFNNGGALTVSGILAAPDLATAQNVSGGLVELFNNVLYVDVNGIPGAELTIHLTNLSNAGTPAPGYVHNYSASAFGVFGTTIFYQAGTTYNFSQLTNGQFINFDPTRDILNFDDPSISAADVISTTIASDPAHGNLATSTFSYIGKSITVVGSGGWNDTSDNLHFANGSLVLAGDQTVSSANDLTSSSIFHGGAGNDVMYSFDGNDTMLGGAGNDRFFLETSADGLNTAPGADSVDGGAGVDRIVFGALTPGDVITSSRCNVSVNFNTGTATIVDPLTAHQAVTTFTSIEQALILGAAGTSNFMTGTAAGDETFVIGGRGAGPLGTYTIDGGVGGSDWLAFNNNNPNLVAVSLANTSVVWGSATVHYTNIENLSGTAGADTLTGDAGNNILRGNAGNDTLDGGGGTNTADYANDFGNNAGGIGAIVNLSGSTQTAFNVLAGHALDGFGNTDTLTNIQNVSGSNFSDFLFAASGGSVLSGNGGDDHLFGGAGNDTLDGGLGFDIADYSGAARGATVSLALQGTGQATGAGTDTLTNFEGLTGSAFNDVLTGDAGNNILMGGLGNDILNGGLGNDTMIGGLGNDVFIVNVPTDIVTEDLNGGIDTVQSSASYGLAANLENLTLTGTAAINGTGNALANIISGNAANNVLNGGAGVDTVSYANSTAAVTVDLSLATAQNTVGAGTDTLLSFENLTGSNNALGDTLSGNAFANVINGGLGNDTLAGGLGNDTYVVNAAGDVVSEALNAGIDTVQSAIGYTLGANLENLTLTGTAAINGAGNALNNVITGNTGNNVLSGGGGVDTVSYATATAAVTVDLSLATAQNTVGAGSDTLVGFANLTGSNFNDTLTGNAFANVIDGGFGNDTMVGGLGNDAYIVNAAGDVVTEALNAGVADTVQASVSYTLGANLEDLSLTGAAAINGTGNALANYISGNAANNVLNGGVGVDTVSYSNSTAAVTVDLGLTTAQNTIGAGTDTLLNFENLYGSNTALGDTLTGNAFANVINGGAGADTMAGGLGDDTYIVDDAGDVVAEAAAAGTDTVQSLISYTLGANVENLTLTGTAAINGFGNALNNVITGNAGNNVLSGGGGVDTVSYATATAAVTVDLSLAVAQNTIGAGSDTLFGFANLSGSNFNDTLSGDAFSNVLNGGGGLDTLSGGAGNDVLAGGLGNDLLIGGAGSDIFHFNTALNAATNLDTIADFVSGADKVRVDHLVFTAIGALGSFTAADPRFFAGAAAHDADDRIIYDASTGALSYDADGNGAGAAVQFAVVGTATHPALAAADLIVV